MEHIDHFMIAANDLDRLSQHFITMSGIPVADGGVHPDQGTHNKLVATTSSTYLQFIAPKPDLEIDSELRASIVPLEQPQLHRIIALGELDRFPDIVEAYQRFSISATVKPWSRKLPTGGVLNWHLLVPAVDNPYGIFAPWFIDWGTTTHPSRSLPPAPCSIAGCHATHTDPNGIRALWDEIGFDLPLEASLVARVTLSLDTPKGMVEFHSTP